MTSIGDNVRHHRERREWTQAQLADRAGVSQQTIDNIERGVTRRSKYLPQIAAALEVSLSAIDPDLPSEQGPPGSFPVSYPRQTIPVYGQAIGGEDGRFVLNGNKVADILCPPSLAGVEGAYGVYVVGDSMVPRYDAGEVVYVHPKRPVRRGDFVVAQMTDDEGRETIAYVKKFVSVSPDRLVLEQFNPPEELVFENPTIVAIHKIVGSGEAVEVPAAWGRRRSR